MAVVIAGKTRGWTGAKKTWDGSIMRCRAMRGMKIHTCENWQSMFSFQKAPGGSNPW